MNNLDDMLPACHDCSYCEVCEPPYSCAATKELIMESKGVTNYDFLRTLKPEEFAHLFVRLRFDAAEEQDWLEWMNMPCKKDEWEQILK